MMDTWDMPEWRRDDGTLMIWDPTSHTYVEGPTEGGDLAVDRGHASGGDNDLFDPAGGNDGHGDGNLFQPGNPDNNGWLDGKTSAASWFNGIEAGDEIIVRTTGVGDGDGTDVLRAVQFTYTTYTSESGSWVARNAAGEEFLIDPNGDVLLLEGGERVALYGYVMPDAFTEQDGLSDSEPGDLTLPEHWGRFAMALRPEQWAEIVRENPYLYHVTEPNRIPSIQKHGLVPGSTVSDKTEGVWTEMGGIPARQGYIYLWATAEGAEHGADWFLGILNPVILTIDATHLDPKLIEADEDYASDDPQAFVDKHGGPTPEEYYGNTDEYDQGNWSGYTPSQIAGEPGSNWAVENPLLGDPDVTYESYKGFGDRQDFHGRVAYGGPIGPDAIVHIDYGPGSKTAASGQVMYHFSPAQNRESILREGLDPVHSTGEPVIWLTIDPNPEWLEAEGDDLWEVNVDGLQVKNPEEIGRVTTEDWWVVTDPIPPERLRLMDARMAKTANPDDERYSRRLAEVAIAPAMPDLNYVLDYNPEDVNETGWFARIWSPNYMDGANQDIGGKSDKKYKDIHPTGIWDESFGTWQQCADFLREKWQYQPLLERLAVAAPDEPFEFEWNGEPNHKNLGDISFMFPVIAQISPLESKTSKVAMPYHVSPRGNRDEIEREGLGDPAGHGGVYYWDTPEQAKAYWDWLEGDNLDLGFGGFGPADVWGWNNTDAEQDRAQQDERLHHDMWNYFMPHKDPEGDKALRENFYNEPWDPDDPETSEFGAWFLPGQGITPDRLKRVAMPYHVSPRKNREKILQEGLKPADYAQLGELYYWDRPEQAEYYGEHFVEPGYAKPGYDVWNFELEPHEEMQSEEDPFFEGYTPTGPWGWGFNPDGSPGAHYIPNEPHITPDRLKRMSMAEQTGEPKLDAALAEFSRLYSEYKRPEYAEFSCQIISWELVAFLRKLGFQATTKMDDPNRKWPETEDLESGDYYDEFSDLHEIGYQDAPQDTGFTHCIVYVEGERGTYTVDFTASQYGYSEFPLVQRVNFDPSAGFAYERNF